MFGNRLQANEMLQKIASDMRDPYMMAWNMLRVALSDLTRPLDDPEKSMHHSTKNHLLKRIAAKESAIRWIKESRREFGDDCLGFAGCCEIVGVDPGSCAKRLLKLAGNSGRKEEEDKWKSES